MSQYQFVPKKVVIYLHEKLIQLYGGKPGIRDTKLLDSALAQPQQSYNGELLHQSVFEIAAAYGYYLCHNHPFFDGNKRITLVVMDVFLQKNGYEISASEKEAYKIIVKLANGDLSKNDLVSWLRNNTEPLEY